MDILIWEIANGITNQNRVHDNTNSIVNTIGISWQACAGHALDFDWLCHWLSPKSGSPWLSWTPDLAN